MQNMLCVMLCNQIRFVVIGFVKLIHFFKIIKTPNISDPFRVGVLSTTEHNEVASHEET